MNNQKVFNNKQNEGKSTKLKRSNYILKQLQEWKKRLITLKEFIDENDRYPRTDSFYEHERKLAIWLNNQRCAYRIGQLSQEKIDQLNGIRITWNKEEQLELKWQKRFIELKEFIEENSRYPDVTSLDKKERTLADWASRQRYAVNNGTISFERYNMLRRLKLIEKTSDEKNFIKKASRDFFENADKLFCRK